MTKYCRTINNNELMTRPACKLVSAVCSIFSGNKKTLLALVAAFAVSSMVFYIIQVNNLATSGFEVRKLEDQITQLKEENKKLELTAIELQSIANVRPKIEKLNFVEVANIKYIDNTGATFAQR